MTKKVLAIGAGWEQYALFEEMRRQGCQIIATHPLNDAKSFSLSDVTFVKDSRDIEGHLNIAKLYNVDAVISDNCDYSLYTASIVAAKNGLPYSSVKAALYSNDKYNQRLACASLGIKQPEFYLVKTPDDLFSSISKIGYPIVIKPIDSRGTFGVTIVDNEMAASQAFYEAICQSPSRNLICEKYIKGELVTVDGFCFSNGHKSLTVASRKFTNGNKPVTKYISYPSVHSDSLKERLKENHGLVVKALSYSFGHTHGEYIVTSDNEIYLVECANRGAGVFTSSTINPLLTGINLNKLLIDQSFGCDTFAVDHEVINDMRKAAILSFLDLDVGKVVRKINIAELQRLPYVKQLRSVYSDKQMVESVDNCASRHVMVVIDGVNAKDSLKNYQSFLETKKVEYY